MVKRNELPDEIDFYLSGVSGRTFVGGTIRDSDPEVYAPMIAEIDSGKYENKHFGLQIPAGTFSVKPANIEESANRLWFNVLEIGAHAFPALLRNNVSMFMIDVSDFKITLAVDIESVRQLNDSLSEKIQKSPLKHVIEPERMWAALDGIPLDHAGERYKRLAEVQYLADVSGRIFFPLFAKSITHQGTPCGCGRDVWPVVFQEFWKGGKPRLCDSMCPDCQVEHERKIERQRKARNRKKAKTKK